MVIPWAGISLADLLKRFKPTSKAKFVEFTTLLDPKRMPGQRYDVLNWPYVEGLRIDEAMHPLSLMAIGLYGKTLPNQNGAPLRLVVPWKYGFKNIKGIVRIRFTEKQPHEQLAGRQCPRIRLLRQREPAGGPSALEPGHRAAHRQQLAAGRHASPPCRSTAMPNRWLRCTRAWTRGACTDPALESRRAVPLDLQAAGVRGLRHARGADAAGRAGVAGQARTRRHGPGRGPGEAPDPRLRHHRAEPAADHAGGDTAAHAHALERPGAVAAHAGPVRVLLRAAALHRCTHGWTSS